MRSCIILSLCGCMIGVVLSITLPASTSEKWPSSSSKPAPSLEPTSELIPTHEEHGNEETPGQNVWEAANLPIPNQVIFSSSPEVSNDELNYDEYILLFHPIDINDLMKALETIPMELNIFYEPQVTNSHQEVSSYQVNAYNPYNYDPYTQSVPEPPKEIELHSIEDMPIVGTGKKKKKKFNLFSKLRKKLFGIRLKPPTFFQLKVNKFIKAIYPYYHRPRFRYPYYDKHGNGKLVYGYGSDSLYEYELFRPLNGYVRRRSWDRTVNAP